MERETKRSRVFRSSGSVSYEELYNKVVKQYEAIWVQHKPIWVKHGLGDIYWCDRYHCFRANNAFVANFRNGPYHCSYLSYDWSVRAISKFGNGGDLRLLHRNGGNVPLLHRNY